MEKKSNQFNLNEMPTVSRLLEVNISVSEGTTSYHISTNSDGKDGTGCGEFLEEHGFRDILMEVSDVERSHGIVRTARTWIHFDPFLAAVIDDWTRQSSLLRSPRATFLLRIGTRVFLMFETSVDHVVKSSLKKIQVSFLYFLNILLFFF